MLTSTQKHTSVGEREVEGFDVGTPEEEGDTNGGGVSTMQCKKPVPLQIKVVSERERAWLCISTYS